MAGQNNELLMKNHQSHPTGFTPCPEANETLFQGNKGNFGHNRKNYRSQAERTHNSYKQNAHFHQKWNHIEVKQMKTKVYKINLQKAMKINVTGVV
jgi:hypothetical protein